MEGIKLIPMIVLLIAVSGIIAGAASIVLSKFGTTMTSCTNSSYILLGTPVAVSKEVATTLNASTSLSDSNIINSTIKIRNETLTLKAGNWTMSYAFLTANTINVTCKGRVGCVNATTGNLTYNYSYYPGVSTGSACVRPNRAGSIGQGNLNLSSELYTNVQSMSGITTVAGQVPTVAIIAVMVIIISIIAGVFAYMQLFG